MPSTTLYSFWGNLSGHFIRFVCNHSYGYAFITGFLPSTPAGPAKLFKIAPGDFVIESNKLTH
jgi:hypothetical protein